MREILKKCPFCQEQKAHATTMPSVLKIWVVRCGNCYATGPWARSEEEAVKTWQEGVDD